MGSNAQKEALAEVLCHCPVDPAGHPLSAPSCESVKITSGSYGQMTPRYGVNPVDWENTRRAADIMAELATNAPTQQARARAKASAAILRSAAAEKRAQNASSYENRRKIRLSNLSA